MGRTPTPTGLKVVKGNPGKRAIQQPNPDPTYLSDLTPPAHLSPDAAAVWEEFAAKLRAAKVLTELDVIALEMMCNSVAAYRHAEKMGIDKEGKRVPLQRNQETGSVSLSPWAIVKSMSEKSALAIMAKFGMTPADRTRVLINPQGSLFEDGQAPQNKANGYFT